MEGAADVENAAFAHVTVGPLCTGVEDAAWVVQIRAGAGFCTGEGEVSSMHKCRWSHQDLSRQYVLHLPHRSCSNYLVL